MARGSFDEQGRPIYLRIAEGKIVETVEDGAPGAVKRTTKNGREVWERRDGYVDGLITSMYHKEREYNGDYSLPTLGDYGILKVKPGADLPDTVLTGFFTELWDFPADLKPLPATPAMLLRRRPAAGLSEPDLRRRERRAERLRRHRSAQRRSLHPGQGSSGHDLDCTS
jgi:hypothetical protein